MRLRQPDLPEPSGEPAGTLDELVDLLRGRRVAVLSGAGISTDSGIPDYRGEGRAGPVRTPITYQQFVSDAAMRRRYWARSTVGWPAMRERRPNAGHRALARLERAGMLSGVVTQNVDGLHQAAGSRAVVELHGSLAQAVCLRCGRPERRDSLQQRLEALNPALLSAEVRVLPDGDADIPERLVDGFRVPDCLYCGGMVKADVVFFGENVPPGRVAHCRALVREASSLLVLGSSLTVMSGLRFVRQAAEAGIPVLIVNRDPTRGDRHALTRVALPLGAALTGVAEMLGMSVDGRTAA